MISIILTLIVIGVVLYLINAIIPMAEWVKTVINAVVALAVLIWLLQVFGLVTGLPRIRAYASASSST